MKRPSSHYQYTNMQGAENVKRLRFKPDWMPVVGYERDGQCRTVVNDRFHFVWLRLLLGDVVQMVEQGDEHDMPEIQDQKDYAASAAADVGNWLLLIREASSDSN